MNWRVRVIALAAAAGFLAVALGIRLLVSAEDVINGSGALAQHSGTALYASMVYAGVFLLAPATRPVVAGVAAVALCWFLECLQLTGVPAELSERSVLARLALGVTFDPVDLAWYPVGVLPLVVLHLVLAGKRVAAPSRA